MRLSRMSASCFVLCVLASPVLANELAGQVGMSAQIIGAVTSNPAMTNAGQVVSKANKTAEYIGAIDNPRSAAVNLTATSIVLVPALKPVDAVATGVDLINGGDARMDIAEATTGRLYDAATSATTPLGPGGIHSDSSEPYISDVARQEGGVRSTSPMSEYDDVDNFDAGVNSSTGLAPTTQSQREVALQTDNPDYPPPQLKPGPDQGYRNGNGQSSAQSSDFSTMMMGQIVNGVVQGALSGVASGRGGGGVAPGGVGARCAGGSSKYVNGREVVDWTCLSGR